MQSSGNYWLALFDGFATSIPLLIVALCELLALVYDCGVDRYTGVLLKRDSVVFGMEASG